MLIHQIAKTAHEVNRGYCKTLGQPMASWAESSQAQRDSALAGVHQVIAGPESTPEFIHQCWMARKTAMGWEWGPVRDEARKEHPNLVPWADLPATERVKDVLFLAVVTSFL